MNSSSIDPLLRSRLEAFAYDIAEIITRAAEEAVERGLQPTPTRTRKRTLTPEPRPVEITPTPPPRASLLDAYERIAIQRALYESNGNAIAAGKLLGMSKSAIYRRMRALGVDGSQRADGPICEPLTLAAYEKAAIDRALTEAGGNKVTAARLLGIGKSTLYRLVQKHGVG